MPRGKKGPVPEALADRIEVVAGGGLLGTIESKKLEKMLNNPIPAPEGANGSVEAEQPQLFKEPGIVKRWRTTPVAPETLNQGRIALATFYQMVINTEDAKKATAAQFNSELASLNLQMRVIAKVLAKPTEEAEVNCEWRVIDGENARGLYRLDSGECIETAALTAEDRAAELEHVKTANTEFGRLSFSKKGQYE